MSENQEYFKAMLKKNGLKVTTQRIEILNVLQNRPGEHLTAEEICEAVRINHPEVGLATVYRTVQMLSELGLIDKLILDDGYIRYEIGRMGEAKKEHHHHHLICLKCGSVLSFEGDMLESLEESIQKKMEFQIVNHEVKFFGLCKDCQRNHPESE